MSGMQVKIIGKKLFDFGTLTTGTSLSYTIADRIPVAQYSDCNIILRIHTVSPAGGTITFDLFGDGESHEDPGFSFRTASPLFTSVSIASGFVAPTLRVYGGACRGQYGALRVTGNRTVASALNAIVSLDLVFRSPDDSPMIHIPVPPAFDMGLHLMPEEHVDWATRV
jgi:hypothetical protein